MAAPYYYMAIFVKQVVQIRASHVILINSSILAFFQLILGFERNETYLNLQTHTVIRVPLLTMKIPRADKPTGSLFSLCRYTSI